MDSEARLPIFCIYPGTILGFDIHLSMKPGESRCSRWETSLSLVIINVDTNFMIILSSNKIIISVPSIQRLCASLRQSLLRINHLFFKHVEKEKKKETLSQD